MEMTPKSVTHHHHHQICVECLYFFMFHTIYWKHKNKCTDAQFTRKIHASVLPNGNTHYEFFKVCYIELVKVFFLEFLLWKLNRISERFLMILLLEEFLVFHHFEQFYTRKVHSKKANTCQSARPSFSWKLTYKPTTKLKKYHQTCFVHAKTSKNFALKRYKKLSCCECFPFVHVCSMFKLCFIRFLS